MKTVFRIALFSLFALALYSCGTTRYYGGFKPASASEGMVLLGPVSEIHFIDGNNHSFYDDSLSIVSEEMIMSILQGMYQLPIDHTVPLDTVQRERVALFSHALLNESESGRGALPIPVVLDNLLEDEGSRYGIMVFANGFVRDKKGIRKDAAKGVGLAIMSAVLTLGNAVYISTPITCLSSVSVAILDSKTNSVVFYDIETGEDKDPTNRSDVRRQLKEIFSDFIE